MSSRIGRRRFNKAMSRKHISIFLDKNPTVLLAIKWRKTLVGEVVPEMIGICPMGLGCPGLCPAQNVFLPAMKKNRDQDVQKK